MLGSEPVWQAQRQLEQQLPKGRGEEQEGQAEGEYHAHLTRNELGPSGQCCRNDGGERDQPGGNQQQDDTVWFQPTGHGLPDIRHTAIGVPLDSANADVGQ